MEIESIAEEFHFGKEGIINYFGKEKKSESEVSQSSPTLCDPMDCSPLSSSVYGVFHERVLEWVAISFSRESS